MWDIGQPTLPSYDGVSPKQLMKLFPDYGDVYNITWSGANRWLLAGTAAGLVGWNIEDDKVEEYILKILKAVKTDVSSYDIAAVY